MPRSSTGRRGPASGRGIRFRPLTARFDALTQILMNQPGEAGSLFRRGLLQSSAEAEVTLLGRPRLLFWGGRESRMGAQRQPRTKHQIWLRVNALQLGLGSLDMGGEQVHQHRSGHVVGQVQ